MRINCCYNALTSGYLCARPEYLTQNLLQFHNIQTLRTGLIQFKSGLEDVQQGRKCYFDNTVQWLSQPTIGGFVPDDGVRE